MGRGLSPWIAVLAGPCVLAGACGRFGFDPTTDQPDGPIGGGPDAEPPDAEGACTDPTTWYPDDDGDGHGNGSAPVLACAQPPDHVALGDDCDDAEPYRYPGAVEVCDGIDNDCDGATLETCIAMCNPRRRPPPDEAHRYLFCGDAATWTLARDNCSVQGYSLAIVNDGDENAWLASTGNAINGTVQQWIGANDQLGEGTWRWLDGKVFWQGDAGGVPVGGLFSSWRLQEPNDSDPMGEDCAELVVDELWNDVVCIATRQYACELE